MAHRTTNTALLLPLMATALVLVLGGCYYDNEEELYKHYYGNNQCDTMNITFNQHIEPLIEGNCALPGCHVSGGGTPVAFENYNNVMMVVNNGKLADRVLVRKDMPPVSPLTDCQMKQIQAWLNAGAPQ